VAKKPKPPPRNTRVAIAERKRQVFLSLLAKTGKVFDSAIACGFTDTTTLNKYRKENEDFSEAWSLAVESAANVLEQEAIRRAIEGVEEEVYHKGKVVGHKTKHSDSLLMFVLRGLKPDTYRENVRGGDVNVNFGIAVLPMTAKNETHWEQRAVDMHNDQKVITIEEKPVENNLSRIDRGD